MKIQNASVRRLFWDTDPNELDTDKHQAYIIKRIFTLGDKEAWIWAVTTYSKPVIKNTLINSRSLSKKDVIYFSHIYNLDPKDFRCTQMASPQTL